MKSLAIITTHPIQYNVPLFKELAKSCRLMVFYTWGEDSIKAKYDPDFKKTISWDIPLLDGYDYTFLNNISDNPGSHHFKGIKTTNHREYIDQFKPDALLVYGWSYQTHLDIIRHYKKKIPIWFRGDSHFLMKQHPIKAFIRKCFLSWIYRHIDLAFYAGEANKKYFEKLGLKPNQLKFMPHAIDNHRFEKKVSKDVENLRLSLNLNETDILILFAGKFEPIKSPLLLLNAFKQLNNPKVHILFLGNGVLEQALKASAKGLKHVHFHEFANQSQMPTYYQASDLFCLPSQGPETWGLAVNEAMACGKAIIVSNQVGCANDLVKNGLNGYIFTANNEAELVEKLNLFEDKLTTEKFGQESKKIISNWSIENQAKILIDSLNESN